MSSGIYKTLIGIAGALWLVWVILLYVGFHPHQLELYAGHPYLTEVVLLSFTLAGLGYYSYHRLKSGKYWNLGVRGWHFICIVLVVALLFVFRFWSVIGLPRGGGEVAVFFVLNSLWYLFSLLFLGIGLTALGKFLLDRWDDAPESSLLSMAIGTAILGFVSALLGLIGGLYGVVLAAILVGAMIGNRKFTLKTLSNWLWEKHKWRQYHWWQLPVAGLGLFIVSIYWIGGIKAFATGYDGSALYANLAQLVADTHQLPGAYQAFGWSVVMSWGKLVFGSFSISILLSHAMYIPALALAYTTIRSWLKSAYALLAVVLVSSLPMISFQTLVDEKVDLGLLFISIAIIYLLQHWKIPKKGPEWKELLGGKYWYPAVILGLLLGFAFTIKYTTVFLFTGVLGWLSYRYGKVLLFAGWNFLFLGLIFLSSFYHWGNLEISDQNAQLLGLAFGLTGLALTAYYFWQNRSDLKPWLISLVVIGASFSLVFTPWAGKHLVESDYELSMSGLLYGKPDRISITIGTQYLSSNFNQSPKDRGTERSWTLLTQDAQAPSSQPIADEKETDDVSGLLGNVAREELQRYLGYEEGIWRYLTIPFDLTANVNVAGLRHQEIGFFWLILLPLLLLWGTGRRAWLRNTAVILLMFIMLSAWLWSLTETPAGPDYFREAVAYQSKAYQSFSDWTSSDVYYAWQSIQSPLVHIGGTLSGVFRSIATFPAIVFIPLLLLLYVGLILLLRPRYQKWAEKKRELTVILTSYILLWVVLGNSITWYAMLIWVLVPAYLVYYLQKPDELLGKGLGKLTLYFFGVTIALQLLSNTLVLLSSSQPKQETGQIYNWPMVDYLTSVNLNHYKTLALFDRYSSDIVNTLNQNLDARIYRVNTYLQFHIEQNSERVFEDNQLDRFTRILSLTRQPSDFLSILRDNGFQYILYDLNSHTLDQTPEQTLLQKCQRFLNLLVNTNQVELVLTDNFVEAPPGAPAVLLPNGQSVVAQQGIAGKTVYSGRVALFRIK